jgi:hypothetical protein
MFLHAASAGFGGYHLGEIPSSTKHPAHRTRHSSFDCKIQLSYWDNP